MDSKSLECFIALFEERRMRSAAGRLFISQQGLSRIIINLEKELGCKLFERKRSGMIPTREGERLYESARRLRTELVELRRDIDQIQLRRPTIRLACAYGSLHFLHQVITRFKREHPEIDVVWEECIDEECEHRLDAQEADIAFNVFDGENSKRITQHLIKRKAVLLVAQGDPLYDREFVRISELEGHRILIVGNGFHLFSVFKQRCLDHGFYPDVETGIREIDLVPRLVKMGEGLGITVDFIGDMINIPGVRTVRFDEADVPWEVVIARNADSRMTPSMELFWDFVVSEVQNDTILL